MNKVDLFSIRARQRAGRPGSEIFDPGFFDPEKNLNLNPEPGPDLKFSPETGPDPEPAKKPGPARKKSKIQNLKMDANRFN